MPVFKPSLHSGPASSGVDYGFVWASLIGPAISAAGAVGSSAVKASSAKKSLASQQKQEAQMAKAQEELLALQTEQIDAQTEANEAAGALEGLGNKKTLYMVGGILLAVGMVSSALIIRSKKGAAA